MWKGLKTIGSLWRAFKWLRKQKQEMEKDTNAYLSDDRARAWRLNLEKFFTALEKGTGAKQFPLPVQKYVDWLFDNTTMENRIGYFGQALLKSKKMDNRDERLEEPIR
jgi:hypothetical protein